MVENKHNNTIRYDQWDHYLEQAKDLLTLAFLFAQVAKQKGQGKQGIPALIQSARENTNHYIGLYQERGQVYHSEHHPLMQLLTTDAQKVVIQYSKTMPNAALADTSLNVRMLKLATIIGQELGAKNVNLKDFFQRLLDQIYHDCLYHLGDPANDQVKLMDFIRQATVNKTPASVDQLITQQFSAGSLTVDFTKPLPFAGLFKASGIHTIGQLAASLIYPNGKGGFNGNVIPANKNHKGLNEFASMAYAINREFSATEAINPLRVKSLLQTALTIAMTVPFDTQAGVSLIAHNFYLMLANNKLLTQALGSAHNQDSIAAFVSELATNAVEFSNDDIGNFYKGGDELFAGDKKIIKELNFNALNTYDIETSLTAQLFVSIQSLAANVTSQTFMKQLHLDSAKTDPKMAPRIGFIRSMAAKELLIHRPPTLDEIKTGKVNAPNIAGHDVIIENLDEAGAKHLHDIAILVWRLATKAGRDITASPYESFTDSVFKSNFWQEVKHDVTQAIIMDKKVPEIALVQPTKEHSWLPVGLKSTRVAALAI